jgi:hypothetical protein
LGLFGNAYFHVLGQELLTQQQYDRSLRQILNNSAHLQVVARSAPSTAVPKQPLDYSWGINLPNGTALQVNPLQSLLANSSFTVMGNSYPVVRNVTGPTITYVPVTITNSEGVATTVNFQQLLKIDWSTYAGYLNANVSNVRFYNSTSFSLSTELSGWIEDNNTTTATSSNVWVNLLGTIVPAQSTDTIYMEFLPKTSSWSSHWGLAPQLSTPYGKFDNGAKVFEYYVRFGSLASLPSGWSTTESITYQTDDIRINDGGAAWEYLYTTFTKYINTTIDLFGNAYQPNYISYYINSFGLQTSQESNQPGYSMGVASYSSSGGTANIWFENTGSSNQIETNGIDSNYNKTYTISVIDSTSVELELNYSSPFYTNPALTTETTNYLFFNTYQTTPPAYIYYIDARETPPYGVMPSVSFETAREYTAPSSVSLTSVVQSNSFVSNPPPLLNTNFSAPQSGTYTVSFESYLLYDGQMYGVTWSSGLTVSQLYNTSQGITITLVGPSEIQRNVSTAYVIEVDLSGGAPLNSVNATKSILGNLSVSIYYSGNFIGFASPYLISSGKIGFGVNESALGSTYAISAVVKPTMVLGRNVSASAYLPFGVLPYDPSNPPTTQDGIISFLTSEPMLIFYFVAAVIGVVAYFWPRIPWVARREERKQSMDAVGNTVEGIIALKVSDNQPLTATETVMWNAIPQDLRNDLITRLTSGKIRKYSKRNTNEKKKRLL